ncbi:MAG: ABC transporter permease [Chloroflexaceae bacterium]|nr:ABC transporter permease [Chloroflexaceae bacterium]
MFHIVKDTSNIATHFRATWQRWKSVLTRQHAGLLFYQWLWIAWCIVLSLVVGAPRILSRPVIYQARAETHFDTSRYHGLYQSDGSPGLHFQIAFKDAREALNQRALAHRELRFGRPDYHIEYVSQEPGVVSVYGISSTAQEARQLANAGAVELVRQIQASGGREILRNLLGWELVGALHGEPPQLPDSPHLRAIIEYDAFPMSLPIGIVSDRVSIGDLSPEEQSDLTRALEARDDLWTFEINTHNATLDVLCGTAWLTTTPRREAVLRLCADANADARNALDQRNSAITRRQVIREALIALLREHQVTFTPWKPGVVFSKAAALPTEPEPRYIGHLLALTVLTGLGVGVVSVAIDRSAGLVPKLGELWRYQELIRDLVVRELRVRYKGSVLGYLWTQLAPLLMMSIFTFVFTILLPSNIAIFPVFLIVALLPWNYCNEAVAAGTRSILDNANLVKKVFFPREILPLASILSSLLNYVLSLPMMFLVMGVTQWLLLGRLNFSWTFLYLPVMLVVQTLFLIGVVLFLSALAVFFRDVVHLIGILLMFWFFLTPVFYSLNAVSTPMVARVIRWLNPMASIIDFYRDILYGNTVPIGKVPTPAIPALDSMLRVVVTTLLVLAVGYWFFQRHSGKFGEVL